MGELFWFLFGVSLASVVWILVIRNNQSKFKAYAGAAEKMIAELKKRVPHIVLILIICSMMAGPAVASDSWLDHSTIYASWEHLWFSWYGYIDPTFDDVFNSAVYDWWGETVYVGGY